MIYMARTSGTFMAFLCLVLTPLACLTEGFTVVASTRWRAAIRDLAPARARSNRGSGDAAFWVDRLAGLALALYCLAGTWGLHRVMGLDPSLWWQPRSWAVAGLLWLAWWPRGARPGRGQPCGSVVAVELVWLGVSALALIWAPDIELASAATIDLALMALVALALHRLVRRGDAAALIDAFERAMLGLLLLLMAAAVAGGIGPGRLATLGGGPNVFGRNMGLLCVLALDRAMRGHGSTRPVRHEGLARFAWPSIAAFAGMLVALSGSRGAMFSTAIALACLMILGRARLARRLAVVAGFVVLALVVVATTELGAHVASSFATRVLDLFFREHYVSGRDRIYVIALEGGFEAPLVGHGLASFPAATKWPYAHNIVLDAWFETGALGVAALALYFATAARATLVARAHERVAARWVGIDGLRAAALLILVASQFSGGRYDARGLLVLVALSLVHFARSRPTFDPTPTRTRP